MITITGDAIVAMEMPPTITAGGAGADKRGKPDAVGHQAPVKKAVKKQTRRKVALKAKVAAPAPLQTLQVSTRKESADSVLASPSKPPLKCVSIQLSPPSSSSPLKQENVLPPPSIILPPASTKAGNSLSSIMPTMIEKIKLEVPSSGSPRKMKSSKPPPLIYIPLSASDSTLTGGDNLTSAATISNGDGAAEENDIVDVVGTEAVKGSVFAGGSDAALARSSPARDESKQENATFLGENTLAVSTSAGGTATVVSNGPVSTVQNASASGESATAGGNTVEPTPAAVSTTENMIAGANAMDTTSTGGTPEIKKFGIFDLETVYSAEMEWSSDESASISGVKNAPQKLTLSTSVMKSPSNSPGKPSTVRRGVWSEEEAQCLTEGVEIYGEGKWKEIRAAYSVLGCRTTSQLKDKYRNIKGRRATTLKH